VPDPLVENPRAFAGRVAGVLAGSAVTKPQLTGFVSSDFDPFLNHLFARGTLESADVAAALGARPGFVWLDEDLAAGEAVEPGIDRARLIVMQGMSANIAGPPIPPPVQADIKEVRSAADLDAWHQVYRGVLGADPSSRADWGRVHAALGPAGDGSLVLVLARVDGEPAATGGVFIAGDVAGLYCFATREPMRGRGLASALTHASHAAARARGVKRTVLQATPAGRPVYARAGYREERPLPVLRISA
jgi:GNAT superfamily N-acetyltransferase